MKFSQILIALALGLVIFAGIFMSESARQANFQTLENPFDNTETLPDVIVLDDQDEVKTFFSQDRSLWSFYPGSYAQFEGSKQEIINGPVFASFNFITETKLKELRHFKVDSFDPETFTPTTAQIKVDRIAINAPGASVFVNRDNIGGTTNIYSYDHALDVWFPEASRPFVLPPQSQITISDKTVDRLGKLYYTKLKKDLRLKAFDMQEESLISQAVEVKINKLDNVKTFAEGLPRTWYWFDPGSAMGQIASMVKYLQRDYALGISQSLRKQFYFDQFVEDFLAAHYRYLNNNSQSAETKIESFLETLGSSQWQRFLVANPSYSEKWNFLGQNQKVWLHHAFQDDPEYVFAPVWFSEGRANTLADLEDAFYEVEEMMGNQFTAKARQGLKNLNDNLESIEFVQADSTRVTRVRRLLNEIMKKETILQNEEVFSLLQKMIELEVSLYARSNPNREEIILENAQDVLSFLKIFIEDRTAGKINQTLVNTYSFLEIDQIEAQLGRTIFTQAEKETIRLVQFVRAEDLTEGELEQIQEAKSLRDLIDERFAEIEAKKDQEVETVFTANKIDTEQELISTLGDARVLTEGILIESQNASGSNPSFTFRGAYYDKYPLNGVFRIDTQEFNFVKLQNIQEKFVDPRYLSAILRRMSKDIEDQIQPEILDDPLPSQNTPLAILQRKLVRETFEQEGLRVSNNNVTITNNNYNEFEITDALMGKEYKIRFTYFQKEEYVTNLVVEYVRNRFEFGDQVIPRAGIQDFITESVQERFKIESGG